jgi:hypothetical protein
MDTIINVIGIIAFGITVLGILFKEKDKVMLFFTIYFVLMLLTYFLKGEYAGSALVLIGLVRSLTYYFYSKKKLKPNIYVLVIFEVALLITFITMYTDILTIVVMLNFMIITFTSWQNNMTIFRLSCAILSPFMILFNFYIGAGMLAICEALYFISILVSIYKNDIIPRRKTLKAS